MFNPYSAERDVQRRKDETQALADRHLAEKLPEDGNNQPGGLRALLMTLLGKLNRQPRETKARSSRHQPV